MENNGEGNPILGMSFHEALEIWTREGKPVIHLRAGENCFDLEKLLSYRDVMEEHIMGIRRWLDKVRKRESITSMEAAHVKEN